MIELNANDSRRWVKKSACSKPDMCPQWWDVIGTEISADNRRAMRICETCPVADLCWAEVLRFPLAFQGTIRSGRVVPSARSLRRYKSNISPL